MGDNPAYSISTYPKRTGQWRILITTTTVTPIETMTMAMTTITTMAMITVTTTVTAMVIVTPDTITCMA